MKNEKVVKQKKLKLKNWVKYFAFFVMGVFVTIIISSILHRPETNGKCYFEQNIYFYEIERKNINE